MKKFIYLALICCAFFACEESNNENETPIVEIPDLPELSYVKLEEYMRGDGNPVNRTDEYFYTEKRLTRHLTTQEFGQDQLCYETNLSYAGNLVTITDSSGNSLIYTLNDKGRATQCTRTEAGGSIRKYTFGYSDETEGNYLASVKEEINGKFYSEATFEAETSNSIILTVNVNGVENKYLLTLGELVNKAQIPWIYTSETYPLSFHTDAMYAHLFGKDRTMLLSQVAPVGGDEVSYYTYTTQNDGCLVSCDETIISGGYTYPSRDIKYEIKH